MEFTIRGNGQSELNDVTIPIATFQLRAAPYTFLIKPKSKFWRFGVRFGPSVDSQYGSINSRYSQKDIKHIEVCAGSVSPDTKDWVGENRLYLQEYHVASEGSVVNTWESYAPGSEVLLEVRQDSGQNILVSCEPKGGPEFQSVLPMAYTYFRVFGWADNIDFELGVEIKRGMRIRLNQVKALSGQEIDIDLQDLMVFFGPNNSGKSSIVLGASHHFMNTGSFVMDYVGPNRLDSSDNIDIEKLGKVQDQQDRRKGRNSYLGSSENTGPDPMIELSYLDRETREKVLDWFSANVDSISISRKEVSEYQAVAETKIGSFNPRVAGTGSRAILSIVVQLFNPEVKFLAIDEPELSLEPKIQKRLFDLIKRAAFGDGMPQKNVLIATHSHIFLDKESPQNNFKVMKVDGKVHITQVQSIEELQEAVYTLLGGAPSDLFFPDNIVVVEGRSDMIFLEAALTLLVRAGVCSRKGIVFHFVEGTERGQQGAVAIEEMLKTQSYTPVYRDRICGLFDQALVKGAKSTIDGIRKYFNDDGTRFVTLGKDALEYYYPLAVVQRLIGKPSLTQDELEAEVGRFVDKFKGKKSTHRAEFFGLEISKVDLAKKVADALAGLHDHEILDNQIVGLLKLAVAKAY